LRREGGNRRRHIEKFKKRSGSGSCRSARSRASAKRPGAAEAASASPAAVAAIRLSILSGGRKRELQRRWVSFERSLLELPDSKTGSKVTHLNAHRPRYFWRPCRGCDGNPYALPGERAGSHIVNIEKPGADARQAAGLVDVRLQDLRHSFTAVGASAGFSLPSRRCSATPTSRQRSVMLTLAMTRSVKPMR
jgi:hypothetical protein